MRMLFYYALQTLIYKKDDCRALDVVYLRKEKQGGTFYLIKAVIFDLDGTLLDTLTSLETTGNRMLRALGLKEQKREQYKYFVGDGAVELVKRALAAAGDTKAEHFERGMKLFRKYFKEGCSYEVHPYDGIHETLHALLQRGIQIAVLSNKPHMQTEEVIREYFGEGVFTIVRGQMDGVPKKPDPAGAYAILEELGVKPEECLYAGDTNVDMQTGRAAGMHTVGVLWGFRPRRELEENGAQMLIETPRELVGLVEAVG